MTETTERWFANATLRMPSNYDTFKAETAKHLKHKRADFVRESMWRQQYLSRRTPEQAAESIDTNYLNNLPKAERLRKLGA